MSVHRVPIRITPQPTTESTQPASAAAALITRSTEMQSMQEALAREHMRRREHEARRYARSRRLVSHSEARPRARRLLHLHG
jgi:hypothetical protein